MRTAFINGLCGLAQLSDNIVLLSGDLGYSVVERFADRFPKRFFNVGVAEQNMMGIAAGLAATGKIVLTYTIANFGTARCLEQFRNDVCYHNLSVISVIVGAGVGYGPQGYTHHGIEDVGFTRTLPNIAVASPGDPMETQWALEHLITRSRPASLRLGRGGEAVVHGVLTGDHPLEKAIVLTPPGADATILCAGSLLSEAQAATADLKMEGIDVGLISMPFVEPLDHTTITEAARRSRLLISVEEHVPEAGFGGAVAEVLSGLALPCARLMRAGIARNGPKTALDQAEIRRLNGIDRTGLAQRIRIALAASAGM